MITDFRKKINLWEKCFSTFSSYFSGARTTWEIIFLFLPLAQFHLLQSMGDHHSIETASGMISVLSDLPWPAPISPVTNDTTFGAGDWEEKSERIQFAWSGYTRLELSSCSCETSQLLQRAGLKCNIGNTGKSPLRTETKHLAFTCSTLALWEMSETQLCPLGGCELRNPKASRADESCVMANKAEPLAQKAVPLSHFSSVWLDLI